MTKRILWANEPLPPGMDEKDVSRLHHPKGVGSTIKAMTHEEHVRELGQHGDDHRKAKRR